ncbi:MFS transporter [Paraburkholderia youngii]|uniref:MFS transporter n=1 Tax=Paraburkholderia youngii TaxID=2782701 RepID=UPI003D1D9D9D
MGTILVSNEARRSGGARQTKKATASGWIGSALEYYDFFIYAQAASLIFPQLFFPAGNPKIAIVASLATYGVGYIARPIGAFFLGRWGDIHGRKNVLLICLLFTGLSTMAVGLLPTYQQVGVLAPTLLVVLRLVQGFAVAGEISGSSSMILEHAPFGRRGFYASFALQGVQVGQLSAAAVFLPLAYFMREDSFISWGWRIPFLLSAFVLLAGYLIRRGVDESPVFAREEDRGAIPMSPIVEALRLGWKDMIRVAGISLTNVIAVVTTIFGAAYAVQPSYGIGLHESIFLWIPVIGNCVAAVVIPFVGNLSDKIGRRLPIVFGSLSSGLLSFAYLYAISVRNVPVAIALSILMWGIVYQGYNAVFPSFMPELFPVRFRVSAMAIGQNLGVAITALLPALFAAVAPPGATNIPLTIGALTFGVTIIAALAAWSARETYRIPMHALGDPNATPIDRHEYSQARQKSIDDAINSTAIE